MTVLRRLLVCSAFFLLFASRGAQANGNVEHKNRDGVRVVVVPVGKPGREKYESRIEFYTPKDRPLCTLDYSSEDGEHGFGVVKAAWTQDGRYFVFSLSSSGGHQPWHCPTLFYNTKDSRIYSLDEFVEASGISKGEFTLQAPNVVITEAQREQEVRVRFRLDRLMGKSQPISRAMTCAEARALKPEK